MWLSPCRFPGQTIVREPDALRRRRKLPLWPHRHPAGRPLRLRHPGASRIRQAGRELSCPAAQWRCGVHPIQAASALLRRLRRAALFCSGRKPAPALPGDERLALTICEDAWNDKLFWPSRLYSVDPVEELMRGGGSLILNISASPYYRGKRELRHRMLAAIAKRHHASVVMVNQVGGNDSLVFDGASFALGPDGEDRRPGSLIRGRPGLFR